MPVTIQQMVDRWTSAERPLFKGQLISPDGCCCAQGDVLRVCGFTDESLRSMDQYEADRQVAKEMGVSTLQAVLLRKINDREDGCPQQVLTNPELFIGPNADLILKFGSRIDSMDAAAWDAAWAASGDAARAAAWDAAWDAAGAAARAASGDAARDAAWDAAWDAARAAAWDAARAAAWDAAWAAAGAAAWELCGWTKLAGKPFFLSIMGVIDPVAFVESVNPEKNREREWFIASLQNK